MQGEKYRTPADGLSPTRKMVESALMVAMATVLSLIKVLELPNGGSIDAVSMLPILLISYRFGVKWGLAAGLTHGVLQQLLGLKNLSYVSGFWSVVAVIFLDYLIAFAVIGLGGVFRGKFGSQTAELTAGAVLAGTLRLLCHFLSGAVVWGEIIEETGLYHLASPTGAGMLYSFGYNSIYMIPMTLMCAVAAAYLGKMIDFSKEMPIRLPRRAEQKVKRDTDTPLWIKICKAIALFVAAGASICGIGAFFYVVKLDKDTGRYDFSALGDHWWWIALIFALAVVGVLIFVSLDKYLEKERRYRKAQESEEARGN